jgi:hypothetical protein
MALTRTLLWTFLLTTSILAGPGGPGHSLATALVRGTFGTSARAVSIMIEWMRGRFTGPTERAKRQAPIC